MRCATTIAATVILAIPLAACAQPESDSATPTSARPLDAACAPIAALYDDYNQTWQRQIDLAVEKGTPEAVAKGRATNNLADDLGSDLTILAAASWPNTQDDDLKGILRNLAHGTDWFVEVIAMDALCGTAALFQPLQPDWTSSG